MDLPGLEMDDYRLYNEIMMNVTSYNSKKPAFLMQYWLLPPIGDQIDCAQKLVNAAAGATEPPFDKYPKPLFRSLLEAEMERNQKTKGINLAYWVLDLRLPRCLTEVIFSPSDHPALPAPVPSELTCEKLQVMNTAGVAKPWEDPNWADKGTDCGFAGTACLCAKIPKCSWEHTASGGMRCEKRSWSAGVKCSDCPMQDKCPISSASVCLSRTSPCQCANNEGTRCYWNAESHTCLVSQTTNESGIEQPQLTSCADCGSQWHCDSAKIRGDILPPAGVVLPNSAFGSSINVTFDRLMRFRFGPDGVTIPKNSVTFYCRVPPPAAQQVHDVPIERLSWTNRSASRFSPDFGEILNIEINGTMNERATDCDLVIDADVLEDFDSIAFQGLRLGDHQLAIQDMVRPIVNDFEPKNGAVDVNPNSPIKFIFNEDIRPGSDLRSVIYKLGGNADVDSLADGSEDTTADTKIAVVAFGGDSFGYRSLTLDFDGLLEHDTLYTIALLPLSARDVAGNDFLGLAQSTYVFRTSTGFSIEDAGAYIGWLHSDILLAILIIGVIVIFLWIIFLCGVFLYFRVQRRAKGIMDEVQQQLPQPQYDLRSPPAWEGEGRCMGNPAQAPVRELANGPLSDDSMGLDHIQLPNVIQHQMGTSSNDQQMGGATSSRPSPRESNGRENAIQRDRESAWSIRNTRSTDTSSQNTRRPSIRGRRSSPKKKSRTSPECPQVIITPPQEDNQKP
jgi:hypothetical protein